MAVEAYFNAETVWTSDIDKYASIVIKERINKPNLGDLKTVDWNSVEPIDILTAGYPCQPFSTAGQRKGTEDERHIFPYIMEAIGHLRPKIIVLENVRGHLTLGFRQVLGSLTSNGYDARWRIVRASDAGAPHQRARLFIVAYPNRSLRGVSSQNIETIVTNTKGAWSRLQRERDEKTNAKLRNLLSITTREIPHPLEQGRLNAKFVEYMMGLPEGWVTDLPLSRTQQLKILGNGVVPQQAYLALELLLGKQNVDNSSL